jgi:hypothetical protein
MAHRRRSAATLLAATVVLGATLAGCAHSSRSDSASAPVAARDAAAPKEGGAPAEGGTLAGQARPGFAGDAAKGQQPAQVPLQAPADRSIVYNGSIVLRVADVDDAAPRAVTIATAAGGYVSGDKRDGGGDRRSHATLTLRVPADKFADTVNSLSRLGIREESRSISTQDVTAQVADVDSRVATAQASVDRVRALLARAQTVGEVTQVESELARREADLESLKAQQRKLADLTTLSTITVEMLEPDAATPKTPDSGFVAGLKAGWHGFLVSMRVLLASLGFLLPWLIVIGVPVGIAVWALRRRHPARQPAVAVATPAPVTVPTPAPTAPPASAAPAAPAPATPATPAADERDGS